MRKPTARVGKGDRERMKVTKQMCIPLINVYDVLRKKGYKIPTHAAKIKDVKIKGGDLEIIWEEKENDLEVEGWKEPLEDSR